MPTSENRKLAAILFADIVGYTAAMQSDEPKALASLHKFKSNLEKEVPTLNGEIIQFYGDGCLCVFNSSVDAVACAKKLQSIFQSAPKVPVRIGLHAGDIVFREGNVFGDAVNIASRVESMGVPGSVLLSSNVRNQIKNQPDFKLENLGKFEFKNVQEGMTVYALANEGLAIPKKGAITGKLKEPIAKKSNLSKILVVAGILTILGLSFAYFSNSNPSIDQRNINKNEITIFPFDVKGSPTIAYLGEGMVDLMAAQLDDIPAISCTDPNLLYNQLAGKDPVARQPKIAAELAHGFGAGKYILGNIIEVGESLRIAASKYDVTGKLLAKHSVEGDKNSNLAKTVDELIKKLIAEELAATGQEMGSLAVMMTDNKASLKAYLSGEQEFRAGRYRAAFQKYVAATEQDSTFALAWMRIRDAAGWNSDIDDGGAQEKWRKYKDKMPKKWQDYQEAHQLFVDGDPKAFAAFEALIRNYTKDRTFYFGLGETIFHLGPSFGKSALDAKPYFEKAYALDKNNKEALIHLGDIAFWEKDSLRLNELIQQIPYESEIYPKLKVLSFALRDTVSTAEIKEIAHHASATPETYNGLFSHKTDILFEDKLINRFLAEKWDEELKYHTIAHKLGTSGQEKAESKVWQKLKDIPSFYPLGNDIFHYLTPALLIGDKAFLPFQADYATFLDYLENRATPLSIYAATKYAIVLNQPTKVKRLKEKLAKAGENEATANSAIHCLYSIKAFEARLANKNELALALIDTAFQHPIGFFPLQFTYMDKAIIQSNIYEEQGDFEKAISYLENRFTFNGTKQGLFEGYATYKLSQLYEKKGDVEKALHYANLLVNSFQNCDEKYKPWVTEALEQQNRLNNKIN